MCADHAGLDGLHPDATLVLPVPTDAALHPDLPALHDL